LLLPLFLSLALYLWGAITLWRRAGLGRGVNVFEAGTFGAGWLILALALLSPLHEVSRTLFTAHMIEHELVMAVAAPLLVLARPGAALLWALPRSARHFVGRLLHRQPWLRLWKAMSEPVGATALHAAMIWLWHLPVLFVAALTYEWMHWLQHLSFFGSALVFWWAMLRPERRSQGIAIAMLFATSLHTALLGVLLAVSRHLWVPMQALDASSWGLTPLEDQHLAGLVMWVPAGLVYAAAAIGLAGSWIVSAGRRQRSIFHAYGAH
jgi:cytochrome c oxidase assembly factor CtaG